MRIGEVASRSGVSARMLRHYEQLGLLSAPERSSAGYREYGEEELKRILHIESLRTLGLSLSEVRDALEDPDFRPAELLEELIRDTRERLRRERDLLSRLRAVREAGPADWTSVLEVVGLLRQLRSPEPAQRQLAAFEAGTGGPPPVGTLADAALREENLNVAGALSWALQQGGEAGQAALLRRSRHPDPDIRRRVMRLLGNTPKDRRPELITAALRNALSDPDRQVRQLAALASGDSQSAPLLVEMILRGDHDVEAAEALAGLPGPGEQLRSLQVELDRLSPGDPARARVTQALAEFRGPVAVGMLRGLCGDGDPQVGWTAAAILLGWGEGIT